MPDEIEVPLEHLHEHIAEAHEEAQIETEDHKKETEENKKEHAGWLKFVSVVTAVLAVVAAIGSLRAGLLVNEALLVKNDEVSLRTQATDQWNYYQAKSIKGVVYETTAALLPPGSAQLKVNQVQGAKLARQQEDIQAKAEDLEKRADAKDKSSAKDMDEHHIFAFSVSLCQIAIALSAIAALTRSRRVWIFSLAAGLTGLAALLGGFFGLHLPFAF